MAKDMTGGCKIHYAVDSRLVKEGGHFFAIKGGKTDGHLFLKEVADRGGRCAYVQVDYPGEDFGLHLIRVKNPLDELHNLAKEKVPLMKGQVIAITGSISKTTMKEYLSILLSDRYRIFKTPKNANSQTGLPLALLNDEGEYDFLILEMGAQIPGELVKLAKIAPPDIVIITPLAESHLEYFSTIEAIAKEKSSIIDEKKTKQLFLHATTLLYTNYFLKEGRETIYFDRPSLRIEDVHDLFQDTFEGARLVALRLGLSEEEIKGKIKDLKTDAYRYEKRDYQGYRVILDCYNACPTTMIAFFKSSQYEEGKRRIGIIGRMGELGGGSLAFHEEVANQIAPYVDFVLCYGEETLNMINVFDLFGKNPKYFESLNTLREYLFSILEEGDLILVKGSKSNRLWEIFDTLCTPH